ncbi:MULTISPECIES: YgaP family membrane protein [Shimia]|uniref:YgaP family membrane protein n=1 Tax=Shimia TaxID=573139 RepID=UPI001FB46BB4|nr:MULTISPECIES: DUF2892 domain-containing protein [Shimia]MDV4143522.1 DUF2892 domain-containing protein [Shimia sp. FJ5]
MTRNVGTIDRALRIIVGIALLLLPITGGSMWGLIGIIPLATGLMGNCALYSILGINTCKAK